jgi:hypothetical protein
MMGGKEGGDFPYALLFTPLSISLSFSLHSLSLFLSCDSLFFLPTDSETGSILPKASLSLDLSSSVKTKKEEKRKKKREED